MNASELERANTWLVEIVDTIIEGVQWRQEGDEHHAVGQGGLSINTRKGCWFQHSTSKGGYTAVSLVSTLRGCDSAAAEEWVSIFLKSHPGEGSARACNEDEIEIDRSSIAKDIIDRLVDPVGTPAELYLQSRGISGPFPDFIKYLPSARLGEGAIAGLLTARGRVVGVQLGYLDPDGRKSVVLPKRRRFALEKAPDAVFEVPTPNSAMDMLGNTLITEGLEDTLSLVALGRSMRIIGLPGIGTLAQLKVSQGERIIVVRDGDKPGSGADHGLTAGVDQLLLQGASVKITCTPLGEDANSILQAGGVKALQELVADTVPAELSRDGEIARLAQLDRLDYDAVRREAAERLGARVSTLDALVAKRRPKRKGSTEAEEEDTAQGRAIAVAEVAPWPEAVGGAFLLAEISATLRRYVVIDPHQADAVALWAIFTHAFDAFDVAPKLIIGSPQKRSGKTRTIEVLDRMVARPLYCSGIGPAALLRLIERDRPTLLLDEIRRADEERRRGGGGAARHHQFRIQPGRRQYR